MIPEKKKKRTWLKRILLGGLVLLAIGAGIYWYVASEKFADTSDRKSAFTVNAQDFIREFEKSDSLANAKYRDKIITVNGVVSELEAVNDSTLNVKITDPNSGSYVIFAFQEQHLKEARTLQKSDSVSIKGSCSGGFYSEILGTESINFKRCALIKK